MSTSADKSQFLSNQEPVSVAGKWRNDLEGDNTQDWNTIIKQRPILFGEGQVIPDDWKTDLL